MLKFKQFLILEQSTPEIDALEKEIKDLIQKAKDPKISEADRILLVQDIATKTNQLKSMKNLSTSANTPATPANTPSTTSTTTTTSTNPATTSTTGTVSKQSAFDALQSSEFDKLKKSNIESGKMETFKAPTPEDATANLRSSVNTDQSLGKEQLGKFSKSFYRL